MTSRGTFQPQLFRDFVVW